MRYPSPRIVHNVGTQSGDSIRPMATCQGGTCRMLATEISSVDRKCVLYEIRVVERNLDRHTLHQSNTPQAYLSDC
jgi:hypothetical protein